MQDAEVELIMRTLVNSVQTYDEVVEVRGCCGRTVQFSSLDSSVTAYLTDLSVQRWPSSPKLRTVPPAGSRARPDVLSVHAAPHVSRKVQLPIGPHYHNVISSFGKVTH